MVRPAVFRMMALAVAASLCCNADSDPYSETEVEALILLMLEDEPPAGVLAAIEARGALAVAAALKGHVQSLPPNRFERLLPVFGRLGADVVPIVENIVIDGTDQQCINALAALGAIGPPARDAIAAVLSALTHSSAAVRLKAVRTLFRLGPLGQRCVRPLADRLAHDPDPSVRAFAAMTLGELELGLHREAESPLVSALNQDPEAAVRATAVEALGRLRGLREASLRSIERARTDSSAEVRAAAKHTLELLTR